jgi:hypothetical protein
MPLFFFAWYASADLQKSQFYADKGQCDLSLEALSPCIMSCEPRSSLVYEAVTFDGGAVGINACFIYVSYRCTTSNNECAVVGTY